MKWIVMTSGLVLATALAWAGQPEPAERDGGQDVAEVRGEQLLPLSERRRWFRIVEGDRSGERVPLTLRKAREGEAGEWVLALSDLNRLHLRRGPSGGLEVVRLELPREQRAVEYEPAVPLIAGRIVPQTRVEMTGLARVYDLETGELSRTGRFEHTVAEVTRSRFNTPAGEREGYMVVVDHRVDLDLGQLQLNLEGGFVPGEGLVYRHVRYTIDKLAFFSETTRRTAVLAEE